jgi:acetyltransferase-like isoleucine patch superfamily enzyme
MQYVMELAQYEDERGNRIVYSGKPVTRNVKVKFVGSNNTLTVADEHRIGDLHVDFDADNGTLTIASSNLKSALKARIRVGQDAAVTIGRNTSMTTPAVMSVAEGCRIDIGNDVMFAASCQVRADDAHPIFDVVTGKRVNPTRSIKIGNHVWVGHSVVVLGGSVVGDGSVLALGSVLKGRVPNNCIAAGVPATVKKRNVAWERSHISMSKPFYKPDASTVTKSKYWNLTQEPPKSPPTRARRVGRYLRRAVRRIGRTWQR